MLAEVILVHGDIGYKFCWLFLSEGQNQGTPARHTINHLREEQKDGEVKLLYCKTGDQIADVLTKALPKARFETLKSKIGLYNY